MKYNLMPHQINTEEKFEQFNRRMAVCFQMGLGKTLTSLHLTVKHNKKGFILCPKSLKFQWKNELIKWGICKEEDVFVSTNKKDALKQLNFNKFKYVIFHYEQFRLFSIVDDMIDTIFKYKLLKKWVTREQLYPMFNNINFYRKSKEKIEKDEKYKKSKKHISFLDEEEELIYENISSLNNNYNDIIFILDETYKIKNYESQTSKAIKFLSHTLPWYGVVGLDGTIYYNNVFETCTIMNIIKPNTIPQDKMMEYVYIVQRGNFKKFVFRNLEKFNKLINEKIMYRVRRDEVAQDLPSLSFQFYYIEHSKEAQKLKDYLIKEIGNIFEIYTTLRALDSYLDLDEIVKEKISSKDYNPENESSVFSLIKDYPIRKFENIDKLNSLKDIIEEIGTEKIIIFTAYYRTAKWLKSKLDKYKIGLVYSKSENIEETTKEFLYGNIQILITTDSLARGFNANHVNYLIHYDIHPSNALMQQRNFRICRLDSKDPKLVINLVSDVIENDIYEIIQKKQKNFNIVVDGNENGGDIKTEENDVMNEIANKLHIKINNRSKE